MASHRKPATDAEMAELDTRAAAAIERAGGLVRSWIDAMLAGGAAPDSAEALAVSGELDVVIEELSRAFGLPVPPLRPPVPPRESLLAAAIARMDAVLDQLQRSNASVS